MWKTCICKTLTGGIVSWIDIPSFSWSMTIGSSEMSTTREFSYGEPDASGLQLPWSAVASTKANAVEMLATGKRAIVLGWEQDGTWYPLIWGAIGDRTDTHYDTSFDLLSVWDLLDDRYCVEGTYSINSRSYALVSNYRSMGLEDISFEGVSRRGACAGFGVAVTSDRTYVGGDLPIDWNYEGEEGDYDIKSEADYLTTQTFTEIVSDVMNTDTEYYSADEVGAAPDAMFRPYLTDDGDVRLEFVAGSDSEPQVSSGNSVGFVAGAYNDMQVQHLRPYDRCYALGGSNEDTEDYWKGVAHRNDWCSAALHDDPYPLREMAEDYGDDAEELEEYYGSEYVSARAVLDAKLNNTPLCQVSIEVSAYDLRLGRVWPGDTARVYVEDFPSLPDGAYDMRIAEMSGNQTDRVMLTFECIEDPMYSAD